MSRYLHFIAANFTIYTHTGNEALVLCPFHGDRSPSMYINASTGLFFCHSCGEKGRVDRIAEALQVELLDTGVTTGSLRSRLTAVNAVEDPEKCPRNPPETFLDQFRVTHPAWAKRGLSEAAVRRFDLGYSPRTNRLTIPIRDKKRNLLGVIYRRLDDGKPKYLYPAGFAIGKSLFGSWEVKTGMKTVALVEGSLDAIACWDARVPALALLGSRMTIDQSRLLRSLAVSSVVVMTDNDRAGREAVQQIKDALPGIVVKVGRYRSYWTCKDPGEMKQEQIRKMFHSADNWLRYQKSVKV